MEKKRFVILDRDGTINEEVNHLSDPDQIKLIPGAAEGLLLMRKMGLGLIIVTNQSVIGRGIIDQKMLDKIHNRLLFLLAEEGVYLDGIYVCPHKSEENCKCRKPLTGLVEKAALELGFNPEKSLVVGDKVCDIELGKNLGATTFLVRSGYGSHYNHKEIKPDYIIDNLSKLAYLIEELFSKSGNNN